MMVHFKMFTVDTIIVLCFPIVLAPSISEWSPLKSVYCQFSCWVLVSFPQGAIDKMCDCVFSSPCSNVVFSLVASPGGYSDILYIVRKIGNFWVSKFRISILKNECIFCR